MHSARHRIADDHVTSAIKVATRHSRSHSYSRHQAVNMGPKKSANKAAAGRGRGRGRGRHHASPSPSPSRSPSPSSDAPPQKPSDKPSDAPQDRSCSPAARSRADSDVSNVSNVSNASSVRSVALMMEKKKRAKKSDFSLEEPQEMEMLEFLRENPMLWDIKRTDFRRTDKKNKIWEDQAQKLGKTSEYMKGWFKSMRDTHTRLDKKKSGDGAPELTEREQWIKDNFTFLKAVTRHRPEPVYSVKAAITAHPENLDAAEQACADAGAGAGLGEDRTPSPSTTLRKGKGKRVQDEDHDQLQSLQKRLNQSGEILKGLSQPQPITERTAFANYVRDSLLTMNKAKFKKARSAINRILSQAMEEDTDEDEEEPKRLPTSLYSMAPPVRPGPAPASYRPSPSEMYQPAPHMWRHKPPASSVWASGTAEYVDQYMQEPLHHQHPQQLHQQMMPPPQPVFQQQPRQQSTSFVSAAIGSAAQVLNQSPTHDSSIPNLSGLSSILNMSGGTPEAQHSNPPATTTSTSMGLNTPPAPATTE